MIYASRMELKNRHSVSPFLHCQRFLACQSATACIRMVYIYSPEPTCERLCTRRPHPVQHRWDWKISALCCGSSWRQRLCRVAVHRSL